MHAVALQAGGETRKGGERGAAHHSLEGGHHCLALQVALQLGDDGAQQLRMQATRSPAQALDEVVVTQAQSLAARRYQLLLPPAASAWT